MRPLRLPRPSTVRRSGRARSVRLLVLALLALVVGAVGATARPHDAGAANVYWGAYINGGTFGYGDAPFDTRSIDSFEADAGKRVSIVHWGQPWYWGSHGGYQPFQRAEAETVRLRGSIPMITWTSSDHDHGGSINDPSFRLAAITAGAHDAYIRRWADDAKAWGHPLFVRFDNEMNGNWFNWSEAVNGNSSGQFVPMWRHVVDIFRQEGATNVTWVWAPNRTWPLAPMTLAQVYPGASYVDWVGLSAYNWGTNPAKPKNAWQDFNAVFKDTYVALQALAPDKPVMIAETASTEYGGSKAAWITDALQAQLPVNYPQIKAVVWFNWNVAATYGNMDWVLESSPAATTAFRAGIGSSYYAANTFSGLPLLAPVQPLAGDLIRNGSFVAPGLTPWFAPWSLRNDLAATLTQDTGTASAGTTSLRIDLPTASPLAPWAVQVRQSPIALTAATSYTLTFAAKASAPRPASVLLQGSTSPWRVYTTANASLTTSWATYSYTFSAPVSDPTGMLAFNLAQTSGTVWLDDVSLTAS